MARTVVALMETPEQAQRAVRELTDSGFARIDIGLMARGEHSELTGAERGEVHGEVASGAAKGATTGAALGGLLGLAVGAASLAVPGIGPILVAGPLASALAGAGVGAVAGGGIGALVNAGVSEEAARSYVEGVRRGGTLITVAAADDERAARAAEILRQHGAIEGRQPLQ